jgi:hypothetical protein
MAVTANAPRTHRQAMYEVPPWRRREMARAGTVEYASRDSGRSAVRKAEVRAKRRQADKALSLDGATWT